MMTKAIYDFKTSVEKKIKKRKPEMEKNYVDTPGLERSDGEMHFEVTNKFAQFKLNCIKHVQSIYTKTRDEHAKDIVTIEGRIKRFNEIIRKFDDEIETERNFLNSAADNFEKLTLNRKNQMKDEKESKDDHNCRICMEPFDNEKRHRSVLITCRHQFCYECIKNVLKEKKKCALCRKQFEEKDIFKLF